MSARVSSGDGLSENVNLSSESMASEPRCLGIGAGGLSMVASIGGSDRSLVTLFFPHSLDGCKRFFSRIFGFGPGMFSNDLDSPV